VLGLAGLLVGCSGETGPSTPPPDKETSKKIAEQTKQDHLAAKAARAQAKKGMQGGGRR